MSDHVSATGSQTEGRRILVVEDEMMVALEIEDALKDIGMQVVGPVSRLDAALEIARSAEFDAAILDVNIRGGNSYEVADILVTREIPFVFASGYGEWAIEERHRGRPRLAKPYAAQELQDKVLELLDVPMTL